MHSTAGGRRRLTWTPNIGFRRHYLFGTEVCSTVSSNFQAPACATQVLICCHYFSAYDYSLKRAVCPSLAASELTPFCVSIVDNNPGVVVVIAARTSLVRSGRSLPRGLSKNNLIKSSGEFASTWKLHCSLIFAQSERAASPHFPALRLRLRTDISPVVVSVRHPHSSSLQDV